MIAIICAVESRVRSSFSCAVGRQTIAATVTPINNRLALNVLVSILLSLVGPHPHSLPSLTLRILIRAPICSVRGSTCPSCPSRPCLPRDLLIRHRGVIREPSHDDRRLLDVVLLEAFRGVDVGVMHADVIAFVTLNRIEAGHAGGDEAEMIGGADAGDR